MLRGGRWTTGVTVEALQPHRAEASPKDATLEALLQQDRQPDSSGDEAIVIICLYSVAVTTA